MASYQVDMPDGSSYQVDMPDTSPDAAKPKLDTSFWGIMNNPNLQPGMGPSSHFMHEDVPNLETGKQLLKAPIYGAMNAYDTAKGFLDNHMNAHTDTGNTPYAESDFHKNLDEANTLHEQQLDQTPLGHPINFLGQFANPLPELNLVGDVAKGVTGIPRALNTASKGVEHVANSAMQGATLAAEQPKPATNTQQDLGNQSEQTLESGGAAGGLIGTGTGVVSKVKQGIGALKKWGTKSGIEKSVGEGLGDELGASGMQALEAHVADPNSKNMTLAEVTQNPNVAAAQKQIVTGKDKVALQEKNQNVNTQLANELEHLDVTGANETLPAAQAEVGTTQAHIDRHFVPQPKETSAEVNAAPLPVIAQEQIGAAARDISNQKRQEIKDAYTAIAPDETVTAPVEDLQHKLDGVREEGNNHALIHGNEDAGIAPDRMLSEIDNRYSTESGEEGGTHVPVKQLIQDKNNLGDYVNGQYNSLKNSTLTYDQQQLVKEKIGVAQQMRDAIKEHLSNLHDVPSGVEDKSVSEAFNDAETKYKDYKSQYQENSEQYKVNANGQTYGNSRSDFGDNDMAIQKGTAPSLAESGKNTLTIDSPDKLGAQLKNWRNYENADTLVKTRLLAEIKDKGFDKAYTPEVKAQLENNGFKEVSDDIQNISDTVKSKNYTIDQQNKLIESARQDEQDKLEKSFANKVVKGGDVGTLLGDKEAQDQALALAAKQNDNGATTRGLGKAVLEKIKDKTISTSASEASAGEAKSLDFEKFYDEFSKHRDFLQQTLPKDQFDALTSINKELAQNSFMERTNASASALGKEGDSIDKLNEIAIKGTISKLAGIPIGTGSSIASLFTKSRQNKVNEVMKDILTNPARALELKKAAEAAPKDPSILRQFFNAAYDRLPAVAGQQITPMDVRSNTAPIDKEVEHATKPQSNNNYDFSLVSNADADELPGGYKEPSRQSQTNTNSKKNNSAEYQIADASAKTGMPKEFFSALEHAESSGSANPNKARPLDENGKPKSSAYGNSQFTEGTWNEVAAKHNLPMVTDKNRLTDADPRSNPKYSRLAAGYYGAANADKLQPWLQSNFNRGATVGDVYGAHLMGLNGFKQFMSAHPNTPADTVVPMAAKNNKSLFYDKDTGSAYSIRQVYHNIEDRLFPPHKGAKHASGGKKYATNTSTGLPEPYQGTEGEPDVGPEND